MGQYDILWKGMVESFFYDLMHFIFPDIDEEIDLGRGVEFLDKELGELYPEPEKPTHSREMDKLVKVYVKGGDERWVLIHLEVQGYNDPLFAKRMFQPFYRVYDRYDRPVTAIAIFTDRAGRSMPDRFKDHFLGSAIEYRYNTVYTSDYTEKELIQHKSAFAVVLLIAKMAELKDVKNEDEFDAELLRRKTLVANILYKRKEFSEEKFNAVMVFLDNYMLFKKPKINRIFMERVDNLSGKTNTMGVLEQFAEIKGQEGLEKGRKEGIEIGLKEGKKRLELIVANLLKNTELSLDKIASLTNVTEEYVTKIKESIKGR